MAELTPAENRVLAAKALNQAAGISPATELYQNLVLTAIARTLSETAAYLAMLTTYLEPPPPPGIPGLPPGWGLDTRQSPDGERKWGYVLTPPAGEPVRSKFRWAASETALAEGIRHAAVNRASLNGNGASGD